jgi:hypothetical protein
MLENELLEDYLKAVESLTILEENKLKKENAILREQTATIEREKNELAVLRKELAPLLELKNSLIKEGILREL